MLSFTVERSYTSPPGQVWKRISDLQNMPSFWHGQKRIKLVPRGAGLYDAAIDFAFGGSGEAHVRVDEEGRNVTFDYFSGPFTGTQEIHLRDGVLSASWNVRFGGAYRLLERFNRKHFRTGTEHALERLCQF